MSLADYTPERHEIKSPAGITLFSVRGISAVDVSVLLRDHFAHLDKMFELFAQQNRDVFATGAGEKLILTVVRDFPEIAAAAISLAADEPGTEENAKSLPLPVQIEAIRHIGRLTFEIVGGPKNFFASLEPLLEGLAAPTRPKVRAVPKAAA